MINQTREKLLKEATLLMCRNGYSAFSYADLSKVIGISKASIHHHFATKETLAEQVILTAYENTQTRLDEILIHHQTLITRLEQYFQMFSESEALSQLPLCAALSSEFENLPEKIQSLTQDYFYLQINWLEKILKLAKLNNEVQATVNEAVLAFTINKFAEGTSVLSRVVKHPNHFQQTLEQIKILLQHNH